MRMGLMSRCAITVALVLTGWHTYAAADLNAQYRLNVPPLPVFEALKQFAAQTNLQVVYYSEVAEGINSPGAVGELTAGDALGKILGGTGLTFQFLNERTVAIVQAGTPPKKTAGAAAPAPESPTFARLAQAVVAQDPNSAQREGPGPGSDSPEEQETSARRHQDRFAPEDLGEIVVTGTNIRGVYPSSSPVEIYTAEDIARTGATTTEQFISKLPQNLGTRTQQAPGYSLSAPNRESVNGVDLRGLGVGTTLVLLNGRRLALSSSGQAADVSLIPISAIERVEVLTDGASAIYGSDAIGGVVNFVLRDDFDGADTRLRYGGVTSGGLRQGNFTQAFGRDWNSGNALVSYDYFDASSLERSDRVYAVSAGPGKLTPDDVRHGVLATLSQDFGDRLTVDGDFVFSRRDVENFVTDRTNPNPLVHNTQTTSSETREYFANVGGKYGIADTLNGSVLASYSESDVDSRNVSRIPGLGLETPTTRSQDYSVLDLTAMLDGSLFALPAGRVRFSLGGGYMDERYMGAQPSGGNSVQDLGRATTYAFGELLVPLVADGQDVPLVHRLELSLAARYTSHDETSDPELGRDFGDNTSPKIGLLWAPLPSISFRATYGESFRAPSLTELDTTRADNTFQTLPVAGVPSRILSVRGPSPLLDAETAESFTFGLNFRPTTIPGLDLSATYFNIEYTDRVAVGDSTGGTAARANPANFPDVIFRPSSAAQIEELLRSTRNITNTTGISLADPQAASLVLFGLPDLWISDLRQRNLALSELDGIDLSVGDRFETSWGDVNIGGQLTKVFDYTQQVSQGAPVLTVVDTVLLPVDLRGRAYAGLSRGGFEGTVTVNYVDDYANPFAVGGSSEVESWTTVDMNITYDFGRDKAGFLDGVRLNVGAQNLFDQAPPLVAFNTGLLRGDVGFDPANANPVGRFVTVGIAKTW